jgi:hypothetical protein
MKIIIFASVVFSIMFSSWCFRHINNQLNRVEEKLDSCRDVLCMGEEDFDDEVKEKKK